MAATFRLAGAIQNPAYRPTGDFSPDLSGVRQEGFFLLSQEPEKAALNHLFRVIAPAVFDNRRGATAPVFLTFR